MGVPTAWTGMRSWRAVLPTLIAALASLSFALSFGFDYGVDNQVAYLLGGLRLAQPGVLDADWYAAQTTHYHPAFVGLSGALLWISPTGWGVVVALMVVITVAMTLVYRTAEHLVAPRAALPAFLLTLCIATITRTHSVGVSYIVDHILQPSTLGSLGLLAAIPLYLRGQWLASGVALGIGGAFHANFLMLGFPLFGLAHLAQGRSGLVRRLLRQLGPSVVALLLLLPIILKTAHSAHAAQAQEIYFQIRSPHHYRPSTYEANFIPFAAWQMVGIALGWPLLRGPRLPRRRLGALLLGLLVVVWTGTVLTTAIDVRRVAQLFPWRLAPFSDLLCQLLASIAVVRFVVAPASVRRVPLASWALLASGAGLLVMFHGNRKHDDLLRVLSVIAVGPSVVLAGAGIVGLLRKEAWRARAERLWQRAGSPAVVILALVLFGLTVRSPLSTIEQRSTLLRGLPPTHTELFRWMREHTPTESRFLTPPGYETMRYHGQRAIVVDWKSTPILPDELVEWHRRLSDVVGRPVRSFRDLAGYEAMDQARLERLARTYELDYVVVRRGREAGLTGDRVFDNSEFVVLKLPARH